MGRLSCVVFADAGVPGIANFFFIILLPVCITSVLLLMMYRTVSAPAGVSPRYNTYSCRPSAAGASVLAIPKRSCTVPASAGVPPWYNTYSGRPSAAGASVLAILKRSCTVPASAGVPPWYNSYSCRKRSCHRLANFAAASVLTINAVPASPGFFAASVAHTFYVYFYRESDSRLVKYLIKLS